MAAGGGRLRGKDVAGAALLRVQIQRQTHHNSTGKTCRAASSEANRRSENQNSCVGEKGQ